MEYYFNIAGLRLMCDIPFELRFGAESLPFRCKPGAFDLRAEFIPAQQLPPVPQNAVEIWGRFYDGEAVWHTLTAQCPPYAWVQWQDDCAQCLYLPDQEREVNSARCIWELLGIENILLRRSALLLHSSFIRWNGRGILFSAPSGTGKSTQADLWEKYQGSQTLNGDRAALRRVDGKWVAFGLPFAGTSGIYRNESAPLAAIVALAQGPENEIRALTPMEAVRRLLPEFTIHRWDPVFVQSATDLLLQLVQQVPVYYLRCRPDEEAVTLLRDTITKEVTL